MNYILNFDCSPFLNGKAVPLLTFFKRNILSCQGNDHDALSLSGNGICSVHHYIGQCGNSNFKTETECPAWIRFAWNDAYSISMMLYLPHHTITFCLGKNWHWNLNLMMHIELCIYAKDYSCKKYLPCRTIFFCLGKSRHCNLQSRICINQMEYW